MRKTVVHCLRTSLEALEDAWEQEHPGEKFIGSPAHMATFAPGWRNLICTKAADHIDGCCFEDQYGERKREAS